MITGLLIIVIGLVFKYSNWFQSLATYATTKQDKVQFDMDKVSNLFLGACLYTGFVMILGELVSDYLENILVFWVVSLSALITGLGIFIFRVNSVEYRIE